ncbi:MAG: ABC transporter permease [Deltaproteobacteria bacterium]|nr:ABC transporter permease [Deltaproteobacteria bacterium]
MRRSSLMRLRGLLRKEWLQILRDPSSISIAFVLPTLLLFLFGYGVTLDARNEPVGLVVDNPDSTAQSVVAAFYQSPYFVPVQLASIQEAEDAIADHRVSAILWLRNDFSRRLLARGDAPIELIVNGTDANTARIVEGYVQSVWSDWLVKLARINGRPLTVPLLVEPRIWFNPSARSRDYLVPGLMASIMTLVGALLTAMVVAREWERGTMEALMVTPVSLTDIFLGKLVPYFLLGMGGMALSAGLAYWLFAVPLRGSGVVLMAASALFLLAALGMGLLISTVTRDQFVAGQVAIIATYLPAFMLSGFVFDIGSMPWGIRFATYLVAARYFVSILQTVFLAGDVWAVILPNGAALLAMAMLFLTLARLASRKRLE